jgi:hypothetical protein
MTRRKDMDSLIGHVVVNTLGIGSMASSMARETISIRMVLRKLVFGKTDKGLTGSTKNDSLLKLYSL